MLPHTELYSGLCVCVFSGNVKIWDRMSLGVYQQPSAITEDEVQSSDKNWWGPMKPGSTQPSGKSKGPVIKMGRNSIRQTEGRKCKSWVWFQDFGIHSLKKETSALTKWSVIKPKLNIWCFQSRYFKASVAKMITHLIFYNFDTEWMMSFR